MKHSGVVLALVSAGCLAFYALSTHAEQTTEGDSQNIAGGNENPAMVDSHTKQEAFLNSLPPTAQSKVDEAQSLMQQGRHAAAASIYDEVATTTTDPLRSQWAKVEAGICYSRAGLTDKAIGSFSATVSKVATSWWAEEALYRKADLCVKAGRMDKAHTAVEYLRIGFPFSTLMDATLDLKGHIEQIPSAQLESLKARERQAGTLLRTANEKVAGTDRAGYQQAVDISTQVAKEYPETSAAVSAIAAKGDALFNLHRYSEAYDMYTQVFDRVEIVVPNSGLFMYVKGRQSYSILRRGQYLLS